MADVDNMPRTRTRDGIVLKKPASFTSDNEEEYPVEKIVSVKYDKTTGKKALEVKWAGFGDKDNTFEWVETVRHTDAYKEFMKNQPKEGRIKRERVPAREDIEGLPNSQEEKRKKQQTADRKARHAKRATQQGKKTTTATGTGTGKGKGKGKRKAEEKEGEGEENEKKQAQGGDETEDEKEEKKETKAKKAKKGSTKKKEANGDSKEDKKKPAGKASKKKGASLLGPKKATTEDTETEKKEQQPASSAPSHSILNSPPAIISTMTETTNIITASAEGVTEVSTVTMEIDTTPVVENKQHQTVPTEKKECDELSQSSTPEMLPRSKRGRPKKS